MPEAQRSKNQFKLNKGLNTETNEISSPDGYTTDEQNYELLVDGSRRRRKGLAVETGGATYDPDDTIGTGHAFASYNWRSVGGDPDKNFIVHQIGATLWFTDDAETISTTYHDDGVVFESMRADPDTVTVATLEDSPCQFTHGRGVLLVSNKYCRPFYVTYHSTTDTFTTHVLKINVRDFYGIDDGISDQLNPDTLSAEHNYNLRNRGWIAADIGIYQAASVGTVYPNKGQVWFKGYRRITDPGYSDLDGIQEFDTAKLEAEIFGQSSAPQGGLFLDPMDARYSASTTNEGVEVPITAIAVETGSIENGGTFKITATAHGRITGDFVTISGNIIVIRHRIGAYGGVSDIDNTLDGYHEITKDDNDNFFIDFDAYGNTGELLSVKQEGQINGNVSLPKSDGVKIATGPSSCAYHSGRAWFAGIQDTQWADTVFFSKIALQPVAFNVCYQEQDPTNPTFNKLEASDGGAIVIPNLGAVQRMLSLKDALIIFSDQGVWEIGGGQRGVFTASGYSVKKITEAECSSSRSPLVIGDRVIYTGPRGIHIIGPNQYTGELEESNLSKDLVQTLWNDIPVAFQKRVQTVFDSSLQRIYFLYGDTYNTVDVEPREASNANHYRYALILDLRVGAYYKFAFNTTTTVGIVAAYAVTDSDSSDSSKKVKWAVQSTNNIVTCDFDQTDYIDYDSAESPLPYFITGWDDIGDFQRRRQAPIITVFAKRTETGYTQTGDGWDGDNESSNLLTAYWDWTDDTVTGKIGSQNETYRSTRGFVPSATDDVSGYPVIATRNKIRGRGRVLQLRFDGAATKDSHILGYTTNYKVSRGI